MRYFRSKLFSKHLEDYLNLLYRIINVIAVRKYDKSNIFMLIVIIFIYCTHVEGVLKFK